MGAELVRRSLEHAIAADLNRASCLLLIAIANEADDIHPAAPCALPPHWAARAIGADPQQILRSKNNRSGRARMITAADAAAISRSRLLFALKELTDSGAIEPTPDQDILGPYRIRLRPLPRDTNPEPVPDVVDRVHTGRERQAPTADDPRSPSEEGKRSGKPHFTR